MLFRFVSSKRHRQFGRRRRIELFDWSDDDWR
jgi:hypothetical protein